MRARPQFLSAIRVSPVYLSCRTCLIGRSRRVAAGAMRSRRCHRRRVMRRNPLRRQHLEHCTSQKTRKYTGRCRNRAAERRAGQTVDSANFPEVDLRAMAEFDDCRKYSALSDGAWGRHRSAERVGPASLIELPGERHDHQAGHPVVVSVNPPTAEATGPRNGTPGSMDRVNASKWKSAGNMVTKSEDDLNEHERLFSKCGGVFPHASGPAVPPAIRVRQCNPFAYLHHD